MSAFDRTSLIFTGSIFSFPFVPAKVSKLQRIKNFIELQDKEEDLKVCYFKKEQLANLLKNNQIMDAKTISALQWYLAKDLSKT